MLQRMKRDWPTWRLYSDRTRVADVLGFFAGLSVLLEREHLLRPARLYRYRACAPWSHKHAEGLLATTLSPSRSRD